MKYEKTGKINLGIGTRTPENIMSLAEENQQLCAKIKNIEKENRRLQEENEILEEACAFFAASRQKYKIVILVVVLIEHKQHNRRQYGR